MSSGISLASRPSISNRADILGVRRGEGTPMSGNETPQPPQHQARQPGYETEMAPEPDFMPRYRGAGRLDGKVAVITGGDSGIGRAVAILFAREGSPLEIAYLDETADAT